MRKYYTPMAPDRQLYGVVDDLDWRGVAAEARWVKTGGVVGEISEVRTGNVTIRDEEQP